eukprot:scaffold2107_cov192-Alexandrium_tamarense.AAC.46
MLFVQEGSVLQLFRCSCSAKKWRRKRNSGLKARSRKSPIARLPPAKEGQTTTVVDATTSNDDARSPIQDNRPTTSRYKDLPWWYACDTSAGDLLMVGHDGQRD